MTIKTHGRMFTDNTVGITQLAISDGTDGQAIVTDGSGTLRFATVGAGGSVGSSVYVEDIRTGDGTTATFTLSTAAPYEESILVFIDGVAQPTSSFTLPSTTSITFSPAPGNGAAIRICHLGIASSLADCAVTGAKICMGGDTAGDILFYNGTSYQRLTIGTALQVLITNAAVNAPEWVDAATAALPAVGADGNVLTSDGTNWNSETPLGGVGGELVSIQTFIAVGAQGNTAGARGTAQTWTRPSGVKRIEVHLVGQGGNSQNDGGSWGGGAAGAGGYCVGIYDVTDTATATVTIPVAWDGTGNFNNLTFPSIFAVAGGTTMTAGAGAAGQNNAAGGTAVGGALNFAGESGSDVGLGGKAHTHFGGVSGHGAKGITTDSGSTGFGGSAGYCYIKEYSDVSASLVGEKLVSSQLLTSSGTWTRPANITKIEVFVVGGGGNSTSTGVGGSAFPGGGGGTAYSILDVTNLATAVYTVGSSTVASTFINTAPNPDVTLTGGTGASAVTDGGAVGGGVGTNCDISFAGTSSSFDVGNSWFGGIFGQGGPGGGGNAAVRAGTAGCVYIKEYTDASLVSGGSLVPAGVLNPYAGVTAPAGWLLCYGQTISRTIYSTLFTAISTTYGVGDGSTTFALPDMRGRAVAGQDDMGGTSANRLTTPLNGDTLGAVGGTETVSHTHVRGASVTSDGTAMNPDDNGNLLSTTAVVVIQPTIILNYIIKT